MLGEIDSASTPQTKSCGNFTLDIKGRKSSINLCTEDQLSVSKLLVMMMIVKREGVSLCSALY